MLDAVATVGVFNLVPTSLIEKKACRSYLTSIFYNSETQAPSIVVQTSPVCPGAVLIPKTLTETASLRFAALSG